MTTFPTLVPSSRVFTPGVYPNTPFAAWSGAENRVRHSNVMLDSTLQLSFQGLTEAQMLSILNHYYGQKGSYESFQLPSDLWSGVAAISDYSLTNYQWIYAEAPTVSDLPCGGHIVELSLSTVPYQSASATGLSKIVKFTISGGKALTNAGINKTISLSFIAGAANAPVNVNGLAQTVTTSINGGSPSVDASVAGLNASIILSLTNNASDSNFASVSLLLHMDGSNGSTTFTDNSNNSYAIIRTGSGTISTAQSKFGGAAYLSTALNDKLSVNSFNYASGDFTFECWWYPRQFTAGYKAFFITKGSSTVYGFFTNDDATSRKIFFAQTAPSFSYITTGTGSINITLSQWHHVAVTKQGTTLRTFFDGVLYQTGTMNGSLVGTGIDIGYHSSGSTSELGYLDDVRLTQGVARYTASFTPPAAAFPNS